jgi:hypothetical protein
MSMSVSGASPVSYTAPQQQPNDAASFEQVLGQLANSFGVSPQELFNTIKSYMNPPAGGGSGVSGPGTKGGADDGELQKVLGNFAANTLQAGQGMMKEAMEKFFQEDDEPDEDDPDAEPL